MDRTGPVLAEEALDQYQPLGAFGQPVYQSHMQLAAALGQRLGDRYANFFAIPRIDPQGKRVSWISPVEGEPRRWSDLPDEEQASRALDLQVMKSEFDTYLGELRAYEQKSKDPRGALAFVAVMEQALRTPNDGHLHFVGDQPVSTFWGFREEKNQPFETLTAVPRVAAAKAPDRVAAATVAAVATEVSGSRRLVWWWWLLPLLLLALLLWWFWPKSLPFGNEDAGAAFEKPADVASPDQAGVEAHARPAFIERDGVIVDGNGVVVPDGRAAEAVDGAADEGSSPASDSGSEDADAAATPEALADPKTEEPAAAPSEGAESPDETQPDVPEPPAPDERQNPDQPGQDPKIPEQPEKEQSGQDQPPSGATSPGAPPAIPEGTPDGAAGFMRGNWQSDAGLVDSKTRQKLTQEYKFDENGKGETIIRRADGITCRAPAEATVQGGRLQVEEKSNLTCTDGTSFKRSRTVCTNSPSGKAECIGTDAGGSRFKVDLNRGGQP